MKNAEGEGRVPDSSFVIVLSSFRERAPTAAAFLPFAAFSAAFRLADVCVPYFLVNRSTRPSVSSSFCLPVKNGWQLEQISRCSSGLVERVFHVAPHAQRTSTEWYFG